MKLLKSWKHAGARLRSFTWMTSYDPGNRDPRKDSRVCCCFIASTCDQLKALQEATRHSVNTVHCNDCAHQCFSTFLQQNLLQMFALFMELYAMIQVSILLQLHRTVVANFVSGNFGLFWRIPWKSLAEHEVLRNPSWKTLMHTVEKIDDEKPNLLNEPHIVEFALFACQRLLGALHFFHQTWT